MKYSETRTLSSHSLPFRFLIRLSMSDFHDESFIYVRLLYWNWASKTLLIRNTDIQEKDFFKFDEILENTHVILFTPISIFDPIFH